MNQQARSSFVSKSAANGKTLLQGLESMAFDGSLHNQNRSRGNSDVVFQDNSLKGVPENAILSKSNIFSVRIRDLDNSGIFAELQPPFFKNISLVRFSPSGRLLLLGNENCQYFYIYEIIPSTNKRFNKCSNLCFQDKIRL